MRAGTAFWLLVGAILTLSVGLRALDPEPIVRLRLLAFDTLQQLKPRQHSPNVPVRLVMVDDESITRIGQWPWPRRVLADLTTKLKGLGVAVIGFDMVLPDRVATAAVGSSLTLDPTCVRPT
jgi:adenylate cyclase